MDSRLKKGLFLVTLAGAITIPAGNLPVMAADKRELPTAGIGSVLSDCEASENEINIEEYLVPSQKGEYSDMAFANVTSFLYIRSEPTTESEWVGKLYPDYAAKIIGPVGEWTQIESGDVTGYVKTEYIYIGKEAQQKAEELIEEAVEEQTGEIREEGQGDAQGTASGEEAQELTADNSEQTASDTAAASQAESSQEELQGESQPDTETAAEIEASIEESPEEEVFEYAESREEEKERLKEEQEAAAGSGQAVVDYACRFIGNAYVWGGTSLTNGADCSGFVQSVYKYFGINLPRTSSEQRSVGTAVSYADAMPGDIVCYDGHVGIYMGDGQIVNARNPKKGIGITPATYKTILTVRRVL